MIDQTTLFLAVGFVTFCGLFTILSAVYRREKRLKARRAYMDAYISRVLNDSKKQPAAKFRDSFRE